MKRIKQLLHLAASLVVFFLVLELCARLDDLARYGAPIWSSYNSGCLFQWDQLGKRGKPGGRYKKWQQNSLGYRGPELRPGTVRIACLGASETFGLYEEEGQEYPRQLERDLGRWAGKGLFEIVNVAYPGQTLGTAALRVPEMVESVKPRFALIYPSPANYIGLPRTNFSTQSEPEFDWRTTERVRAAAKSFPDFIQIGLREVQTRFIEYSIKHRVAGLPRMDRVPEEDVRHFRSDLMFLVAVLRERGVEPVLVTHATVFGKELSLRDRQMLIVWRDSHPMLKESGFVDMEQRMNDVVRTLAVEQHLNLIDAAAEIPHSYRYFADYAHFTTAGAELMADKIAQALELVLSSKVSNSTAATAQQNHPKDTAKVETP